VTPFGLSWPQPTTATYMKDWGTDPNGTFTLYLDMDSAQVDPQTGSYPNLSKGELYHARILMSKDALYQLGSTVSGLPSGGSVEVKIWTASGSYNTYTISADGSQTLDASLMLAGNATTTKAVPVHVRFLGQTKPAGLVTVQLSLIQLAN